MKLIDGYNLTKYMEFVDGKALGEEHPVAVVRMEHIINTPKVEAEPVKHGRWEMKWYKFGGRITNSVCVFCSNCGHRSIEKTPYCSNCGSKMGIETEDVDE